MDCDGPGPLPSLASEREAAQKIQDSFQAILDALDAARAELHLADGSQGTGSWARSFDTHGELVAGASRAEPASAPSSLPAVPLPAYPRTRRTTPRPAGLVPAPPQGVPPVVVDPSRTEQVRRVPHDAGVRPLWSRGVRREAGEQPVPSDAGTMRPGAAAARPVPGPPRASMRPAAVPPADTAPTPGPRRSAPDTSPRVAPPHEAPPRAEPARPPVAKEGSGHHRRFTDRRHMGVAGIFGLGAVSGLILASSLFTNERSAPTAPPASMGRADQPSPGDTPLPEIPGTGVLRQGDSGHGVYELQVRLLQIPHLYDGGVIDGRFGAEVRQAVARFQQRFGIRGDEPGVYGDNTRYALMLRTK